jgi:hypothetical protein
MPGTYTNVTPDIDAPTMPKATRYHGERLSPRKKAVLSLRLLAMWLIRKSKAKYINTVEMIIIMQNYQFSFNLMLIVNYYH